MQQYIKKNHIHANDYVFQAEQGGAYRIGSFVKRFRTQCKKHKIADCEYVFKTHDYRHTLATQFYDDGVPIQTIRDYLGHVAEEMTKQYVDYMPKKCLLIKQLSVTSNSYICSGHTRIGTDAKEHKVFASES